MNFFQPTSKRNELEFDKNELDGLVWECGCDYFSKYFSFQNASK
jgi:hypothetical protein